MNRVRVALIVATALLLPAAARADRRYYGETYNAVTAASRIVAMSFCEPRSCIGRLSS